MKTQTDPKKEQQNTATPKVQQEASTGGTATIADNRPSTVYQRKLRETMDASVTNNVHPIQRKANKTGLPDNLKSGIETLSGYAMDDVKVHYNSNKPAQLQAHAYAQGTDIHLAPGQEKHLPHEAWHVVQQKQGRVKPTRQLKSQVSINDDAGLEKEADVMGAKALDHQNILGESSENIQLQKSALGSNASQKTIQRLVWTEKIIAEKHPTTGKEDRTELYRLLNEYRKFYSDKNSTELTKILSQIIEETTRILETLDNGYSIRKTIEMIRNDAEKEKTTFEKIDSREEPGYSITNGDGQIDFELHDNAKALYDAGKVGQGYFGAVDLTDGTIYLLPGYNKVVRKGTPKENAKEPENWVDPKGMKEDWPGGIKPVIADPLGQNSGQGHVALAKTYSLNPKEGNLIGFGIMKGPKGKINQFRNRSSSMNFNSIDWHDKDRISLFRQRSIPDFLSNKLLTFLLDNLPKNRKNWMQQRTPNKVVKNYMHNQDTLSVSDRRKYFNTLKEDQEWYEKLKGSNKTDQDTILKSHKGNDVYYQKLTTIVSYIKKEIEKLKKGSSGSTINNGIKLIEEVLDSKDIAIAYKENLMKIFGLKATFDAINSNSHEKIMDYFDQIAELKAPQLPEIEELVSASPEIVIDTIDILDWEPGDLVRYQNNNYRVQEVEETAPKRMQYTIVRVGVKT